MRCTRVSRQQPTPEDMIHANTFRRPRTIEEAINASALHNGPGRYLAGGTDMLPSLYQSGEDVMLIDISGIPALKSVGSDATHLRIGALVTLHEIVSNAGIRERFPALAEAAASIATPVVRRTATVGGNLLCENRCIFYNQSEWWRDAIGRCLKCGGDICIASGGKKACFSELVSDLAPCLIALGAEVTVHGPKGERTLPLQELYTGDGVKPTILETGDLLTTVHVPIGEGRRTLFRKLRQRATMEFTSLTTAVSVNAQGGITIVLGGVDPRPVVVRGNTQDDRAALVKKALKGARAVENDMLSRNYRRDMILTFLNESLEQLLP